MSPLKKPIYRVTPVASSVDVLVSTPPSVARSRLVAGLFEQTLYSLIIFFMFFAISGCAGSPKEDAQTITVWHWMSDREDVFQELARRYKAQTGKTVKFDLYAPSEQYAQRVKASVQTNRLPDIYGILGEKRDFASFIRSGFVADLSADLDQPVGAFPWKTTLFQKALEVNQFLPGNEFDIKPGTYGIPLDVTTIQMVYNKRLYRAAGLDPNKPPQDWDQFLEDWGVLREKGYPGFVSGFGEIWLIEALASNYAMNIMGEEKGFLTFWE